MMNVFGPLNLNTCAGVCFDPEFLLYAFTLIIASVGFGLFTWWWKRMRRATEVYAYVTALLGAFVFRYAILTVIRGLWLIGYVETSIQITTSYWWTFRTLPEFLCILLIVHRMWRRAMRTLYLERRYYRDGAGSCFGEGMENDKKD